MLIEGREYAAEATLIKGERGTKLSLDTWADNVHLEEITGRRKFKCIKTAKDPLGPTNLVVEGKEYLETMPASDTIQNERGGLCCIKELLEAGHFEEIIENEVFNPQPHYDNSKGSLYKIAQERGWNPYLFDIVKRLERGGKKDPIEQEIDKTIDVLKLWKIEL